MQIESNVALISINATLIVQLVSFLIFLFVINRIMFRPLQQIQNTRDNRMAELRHEIKQAEEQIEQMMGKLAHEELLVKDAALERQMFLEEDGKQQVKQIFADLKIEIDTMKADNQKNIEAQIRNVKEHLPNEVHKVARSIMEKTLERRLADEYEPV